MAAKYSLVSVAFGVVLFIAAWSLSVRGQEPPRQDVVNTLLVEVHALREAIEQMSSASARVQLAMGRLQIQEQRVNTVLARLNDIRESLGRVEREDAERRSELARIEQALPRLGEPGERTAVEDRARRLRMMITTGMREIQRLRAEESELTSLTSLEQGRWSDINQQLEELDRSLRRRQ